MNDRDVIINRATGILAILMSTPFEDCHQLTHEFGAVTPRPGIYAFRHRQRGMLYIGKSKNIRHVYEVDIKRWDGLLSIV